MKNKLGNIHKFVISISIGIFLSILILVSGYIPSSKEEAIQVRVLLWSFILVFFFIWQNMNKLRSKDTRNNTLIKLFVIIAFIIWLTMVITSALDDVKQLKIEEKQKFVDENYRLSAKEIGKTIKTSDLEITLKRIGVVELKEFSYSTSKKKYIRLEVELTNNRKTMNRFRTYALLLTKDNKSSISQSIFYEVLIELFGRVEGIGGYYKARQSHTGSLFFNVDDLSNIKEILIFPGLPKLINKESTEYEFFEGNRVLRFKIN